MNLIFFTLTLFAVNALELTSEVDGPYECVWEKCPNQASVCDDICSNALYNCWGKCSSNSCATLCIAGTGNVPAINVWNCALQKDCSPYTISETSTSEIVDADASQSTINKPVDIRLILKEFKDVVGETFGAKQYADLVNFINSASIFKKDGVQDNIKYIKDNMDANYGSPSFKYNVVMQADSSGLRWLGSYLIYCQDGTNFASIGYGVNRIYPTWTYLVYRLYNDPSYEYIYNPYYYGRGTGLTADQGNQIANVIIGVDGTSPCSCESSSDIAVKLVNVIDSYWNVICENKQSIWSYVAITKNAWISLKPSQCVYFIYAV